MEFDKNRFNKFYEYEYKNKEMKLTNKITNKSKYIFLGQTNFLSFVGAEEAPKTIKEAEMLIKNEKGIKISTEDLYKNLLNFDDEQILKLKFGYGSRTEQFLKNEFNKINFLKMECDYDEIDKKYFVKKVDDLYYNPTSLVNMINLTKELELFKIASDKYVLQFYEIYPPDDYSYIKYYFSKEPTILEFNTYELLCKIEDLFIDTKHIENMEIINDKHWTEHKGSIENKFKELKKKVLIYRCSLDC